MNNTEIERKWSMDGFPPLPMNTESEMEQGYLCFAPSTVRIRKATQNGQSSYWLTIKGKGTLRRTEVETPLQQDQYDALATLLTAPMVRKKLRTYTLPGGHTLECSLVDEGEPTSFFYAEVEFETIEQANLFVSPSFLGRDITEEPGQTMAAYARRKAGLAP